MDFWARREVAGGAGPVVLAGPAVAPLCAGAAVEVAPNKDVVEEAGGAD